VGERGKLGHPHLIIVPGSKSTAGDLDFLYRSGMADEIIRLAAEGTPVLGICGGYQILGREIKDPEGVESAACSVRGLGLLDMETVFDRQKRTAQVTARVTADRGILSGLKGQQVSGYEIHMGRCLRQNEQSAFCVFQTPQGEAGYADGAVNAGGDVVGTYIHGIFSNDAFRQSFLDSLRRYYGLSRRNDDKVMRREDSYNRLADTVRRHLDMDKIYEIIEAGVE
jgi:adenosylcobyric acid synthase